MTQSLHVCEIKILLSLWHPIVLHDYPFLASISFNLTIITSSLLFLSSCSWLTIEVFTLLLKSSPIRWVHKHLLHLNQRRPVVLVAFLEKFCELPLANIDHAPTSCDYLGITELVGFHRFENFSLFLLDLDFLTV